MTNEEIQEIISACRLVAITKGVEIPPISIDRSELGQMVSASGLATLSNAYSIKNATIFAHSRKEKIPNWEPGKIMCISEKVIKADRQDLFIIGVIVHEVGHAFNLAAKQSNTEANAQLFEITMLLTMRSRFSDADLDNYFSDRMKPGYFCGTNIPTAAGYQELHHVLRELPQVFSKTHETYKKEFAAHANAHRNIPQFHLIIMTLKEENPIASLELNQRFLSPKRQKLSAPEMEAKVNSACS